jgi:exodeoxyribonuclease VII large subunit
MATAPATNDPIYSVRELTKLVKDALEDAFPAVWVRGELSGVKRAESGHLYFTLKEGREAQISCAMWRPSAAKLSFDPADGVQVEALGGVEVYAPRGQYQLIVREMRPAGLGALLLELEELKRRLQAEGLFDESRKQPLPRFPARIGLVTSPVGAAVRDLIKVLRARWPAIRIVLAPVRVQGEGAALEIAGAIERFNRLGGVDLLIVGRGGGSIEDLWAFNEEPVVRAIASSKLPVISAVGHEVDVTLADLAADVRAATPSNAAEIAVPNHDDVARGISDLEARASRAIGRRVSDLKRRLESLVREHGFRRLGDVVERFRQRVDEAIERARAALRLRVSTARERLARLVTAYGLREFPRTIAQRRERASALSGRLTESLITALHDRRGRIAALDDRLRALSPRLVLERGYCLVRLPDGTLLRAASGLAIGELLTLEFARGEADARVESLRTGDADERQEES